MQGIGTSQVVQWLRLQTSNAGTVGSIPGPGTTTFGDVWPKKKKKKKVQEKEEGILKTATQKFCLSFQPSRWQYQLLPESPS